MIKPQTVAWNSIYYSTEISLILARLVARENIQNFFTQEGFQYDDHALDRLISFNQWGERSESPLKKRTKTEWSRIGADYDKENSLQTP